MRNWQFDTWLEEQKELHNRKNHDYASDNDPYSNFNESATVAGVTPAQSVLVLMGVKVARIVQLEGGKTPNNEALIDSYKDLGTYANILAAMQIHGGWSDTPEECAAGGCEVCQDRPMQEINVQ